MCLNALQETVQRAVAADSRPSAAFSETDKKMSDQQDQPNINVTAKLVGWISLIIKLIARDRDSSQIGDRRTWCKYCLHECLHVWRFSCYLNTAERTSPGSNVSQLSTRDQILLPHQHVHQWKKHIWCFFTQINKYLHVYHMLNQHEGRNSWEFIADTRFSNFLLPPLLTKLSDFFRHRGRLAGTAKQRQNLHFLQGKKQIHVLHLMPNLQSGPNDSEFVICSFFELLLALQLLKSRSTLIESGDIVATSWRGRLSWITVCSHTSAAFISRLRNPRHVIYIKVIHMEMRRCVIRSDCCCGFP